MSVAVVVTPEHDARRLVRWAGLLGRAMGAGVLVLDVTERPGEKEESEETGRRAAAAIEAVRSSLPSAPEFECVAIAHENAVTAVLEQVRKHGIGLLVLGQQMKSKPDTRMLALFRDAPCQAVLLRPGGDREEDGGRILVPTDRGPHTALALQIAVGLAGAADGRVTALFVQTQGGEDADLLGAKILERRITQALPTPSALVETKVVTNESVRGVVAEMGSEYDLVLAGSPDEWTARRVLFGSVQRADLSGPEGTSVAVVRSAAPLPTRIVTAVRQLLEARVPQLSRVDRVTLADTLRTSSRFNFDFVFLTCAATLIAALGLVDNSGAVVIGAMLLAPLMTPLIGAGSAVVQGNPRFLLETLRSVSFGFLLAVALGALIGLVFQPEMTSQMAARDSPGLLDLAVAFFSGVAAAYATARPGLSAALPGVAIAASLVPPLATTGIVLTQGRPILAIGAALLFTTNIIAIILGAALTLVAIGIRSRHLHGRHGLWVRRLAIAGLIASAVLVIWVSFLVA
jgi:uncharacterized hydrophobic protein (TIGR00271 family)